ncbi:MAG: hypothetical protein ABI569_00560 [Casimicrobiaceae bacterium]
MQVIQSSEQSSSSPANRERTTVYLDCVDSTMQDVLAYWLKHLGYRIQEGPAAESFAEPADKREESVLFTDRFGPAFSGEATVSQLKTMRPRLRVVIIGCGIGDQLAQLSLARAAGADATLPVPLTRERILDLLDTWS